MNKSRTNRLDRGIEPRLEAPVELLIESLGARGEGVASHEGARVFVPFGLPGDRVQAQPSGDHARVIRLIESGPDRTEPLCRYFGACGGCAVQGLAAEPYAEWKRSLLIEPLRRAGVLAEVDALIDANGRGRRRATLHVRQQDGRTEMGFMKARAHELVAIDDCPLFTPELSAGLPATRAVAKGLASVSKPIDLLVTATETGLDIDIRGTGPLPPGLATRLIAMTMDVGVARLSVHGEVLVENRAPQIAVGAVLVSPPPGAFMQATAAGEEALWARAEAGLEGARRVADLFCGFGAFALRAATRANVLALDENAAALDALTKAARSAPQLRPIKAERRDLFRRPLTGGEFAQLDAVIFDPPRAGALEQAQALAAAGPARVIAVSCAPATLARDLAVLTAGGYTIDRVSPIDQFRFAPHVETVAVLSRATKGRRRPLLG